MLHRLTYHYLGNHYVKVHCATRNLMPFRYKNVFGELKNGARLMERPIVESAPTLIFIASQIRFLPAQKKRLWVGCAFKVNPHTALKTFQGIPVAHLLLEHCLVGLQKGSIAVFLSPGGMATVMAYTWRGREVVHGGPPHHMPVPVYLRACPSRLAKSLVARYLTHSSSWQPLLRLSHATVPAPTCRPRGT